MRTANEFRESHTLAGALPIERPLAIVMIGGLITSTLFTLLALPTFYELVHRIQSRMAARRDQSRRTP